MKNRQKTVKTKRLRLVSRSVEEMRALRNGETDPEMQRAYDEMLALMETLPGKEEWGCDWRISLKTGETVGGIGFKGPPDEAGAVELGYGIDEAYRRNGYATEAVQALTEWAVAHDAKAVYAQTEPDNAASQGVLKKCGFVPEGEGAEGPRFVYRSPEGENSGIALGMCFGMSLGLLFGTLLFDNMATGLSMGMCLGLALGAAYDAQKKKKQ